MSIQGLSITAAWAVARYRQTVAALAARAQSVTQVLRPRESPEATHYFRAIGIGRNIDVYA